VALERLRRSPAPRRTSVVVAATVNEEFGFTGAKAVARLWSTSSADAAAGDAATALFRVRRDGACDPVSPGVVSVTWRRAGPPRLVVVAGEDGGGDDDDEHASASDATVTTCLPLPPLAFADPVLAVASAWPPRASAGAPLPLTLTLTAARPSSGVRVGLAVADASGFTLAGRRRAWVDVLPGGTVVEGVTLVPHAVGVLALPAVTLTLEGGGGTCARRRRNNNNNYRWRDITTRLTLIVMIVFIIMTARRNKSLHPNNHHLNNHPLHH
jgi:hypothetical protein